MAIVWAAFLMPVFLCTCSQHIYVNEDSDCARNGEAMEQIKKIWMKLGRIQESVDRLAVDSDGKASVDDVDSLRHEGNFIAFNAFPTGSLNLNIGSNVNVVYDGVYYNYGNAYNKQTGVFIAPSDGLYVFSWASVVEPKKMFDSEILLNDQRKGIGNCNNLKGLGYENCSRTYPLVLKAGDRVNIRTVGANHLEGGWSSFSGFKV
ncbi:cerebellin-2-like [Saccostrea cucullata]|uniref:cerebellin-2-like n=1 Tax=Saccostrea cuccullata TaxID=36930 RepID=UPI002ED6B565